MTLAVFRPMLDHEFLKYDDDTYVTDNRHIQSPLNGQALGWAFTTGYGSNWHPLTWLSHMLDFQLFELNPRGHHLISLVLHTANAVLMLLVLRRMTSALWPSALVAALFAWHPLHIESVAWVAERKDVLSTFFWLLTMWFYVRYAQRRKPAPYLLALAFFVLGLMTKPMLVTLPFVLLLLDYWPLQRMHFDKWSSVTPSGNHRNNVLSLLWEKTPFFVGAFASGIITFLVQRSGGAMATIEVYSMKTRIANALVAYVGYIAKMCWPSRLAVLYPHPGNNLPVAKVALCAALLLLLTICFVILSRRRKYLAVGWLWYLGTLVPVIGLVQVGVQGLADRYSYMPLTGLFIIIVWGIRDLSANLPYRRIILSILAIAVLSGLTFCTHLQLRYWKNSLTLFERTLDVTSDNYLMHNNYANLLGDLGRTEEAIAHFQQSLKLRPDSPHIHTNVANLLWQLGRGNEAVEHYHRALSLKPDFAPAHYNSGVALAGQGKHEQAIAAYRQAVRFQPDYVEALSNLGFELAQQGKYDQAVNYYNQAIEFDPDNVIAQGRLGLALAALGRLDEAIKQFRLVLVARPDDVEMYCNLGILLQRQGKIAEAIGQYRQALQIDPASAKAKRCLEAAMARQVEGN